MSRVIAAAVIAAAVLGGCGGGDDGPDVQTQDSYIAQADDVCAKLAQRFQDAGETDPQTPEEIAQSADVLVELYGDLLGGLQDVRLPAAAAPRRGAAAFVAGVRRTNGLLGDLQSSSQRFVEASQGSDPRELTIAGNAVRSALDTFRAEQAVSDRLGLEYGFNVCGSLN
ncbi:MAG TPA: hypothetical protein VMY78_11180 [Solirubrobacteraceae bacterium]|nr:hypothetical protein [Solirubrobacteraceae bacterium]